MLMQMPGPNTAVAAQSDGHDAANSEFAVPVNNHPNHPIVSVVQIYCAGKPNRKPRRTLFVRGGGQHAHSAPGSPQRLIHSN
jgi:hypothetical protein